MVMDLAAWSWARVLPPTMWPKTAPQVNRMAIQAAKVSRFMVPLYEVGLVAHRALSPLSHLALG